MKLHTLQRGDSGPVLLFLHYFGGSSRTWGPVMDALSNSFQCLAVDLRGWGDSKEAKDYSVDAMAADVLEEIDALGGAPFALVGHSMGGKVAQAVAASRPAGLKALALVVPSPAVPEPMTDSERQQLRGSWGSEPEAWRIVNSITLTPLPPAFYTLAVDDTLRASQGAWRAWTDSGSREDISGRMANIAVPTRVFAAEHDKPLSPEYLAREVAARIKNADVVTIPGTCHLVPLERPQELADALRAFVAPLLS